MADTEQWGFISLSCIQERQCDEFIAVEDIESFNKMINYVVKRVGVDGDYIVIESDGYRARLKPLLFRGLPRKPEAFLNDLVKLQNSKGHLEYGILRYIGWHNNNRHYLYRVEVNGVLKTRRYEEKDIQKL